MKRLFMLLVFILSITAMAEEGNARMIEIPITDIQSIHI